MTDGLEHGEPTAQAAAVAWNMPIPGGRTGILVPAEEIGGCLIASATVLAACAAAGEPLWQVPATWSALEIPVLTPDGLVLLAEDDVIVARDLRTGRTVRSLPAPSATRLCLAPWGDLLYLRVAAGEPVTAHCVGRDGEPRWSAPIEQAGMFARRFLPVGDVVVIVRGGVLCAFDENGNTPWIADFDGVRPAGTAEGASTSSGSGSPEIRIRHAAVLDADRLVLDLEGRDAQGLYLLDTSVPALTPIAVPNPLLGPYAVTPREAGHGVGGHEGVGHRIVGQRIIGHRIIGLGRQIEVSPRVHQYPIMAIDADSAGPPRTAWRNLLVAKPITLGAAVGGGGGVVVAASPTLKYWDDYHEWQDLRPRTFVRCYEPDGTVRWTWQPPGPLTHLPAVAHDGTVYVGCDGRVWALRAPTTAAVTYEQAARIADRWVNGDRPEAERVTPRLHEFDLGYVVHGFGTPRADPARPPARVGDARGIIDKQTGALSVWPSLPVTAVLDMYRAARQA